MDGSYIRAHTVKNKVKRTYLSAEGFCFEVFNVDVSKDVEEFHKLYVAARKQMWLDHNWNDGVWSREQDLGYQNFLSVLESDNYSMGYYENTHFCRVPAQIKCCDKWLSLSKFTNTCSTCGSDYNGSGQLLASRDQWGEETGEHWSVCI